LSDDSISPISLVMIADMTFRSITLRTQHATIGEFAGRDAVADAEIILTNSSKQFRFGRVEIFESLKDRFAAMRFKDRRERHRARVVECAIFATPNCHAKPPALPERITAVLQLQDRGNK
jgi:hypothetical protein